MIPFRSILKAYGLKDDALIEPFGNGLINSTWRIKSGNSVYILQRVNQEVFEDPLAIAHNVRWVAGYLQQHHPDYMFVAPLVSVRGEEMYYLEGEGFFRVFPFVQGSHSMEVVGTAGEAFEAAAQFGRFTKLLSDFDTNLLKVTIPNFHNLDLRYQQFLKALKNGDGHRLMETEGLINTLLSYEDIISEYEQLIASPEFKLRVTHHDTKISNVLFDAEGRGLCVIDLDTVMPGYFISDVGDMMRTYISPVSEEESDFGKIEVRDEFYHAIVDGYLGEMKDELTGLERRYFFYAGKFMIYMQALRFLTDYLNGDIYYGARYPKHNLVRASNQAVLLQRLIQKEKLLTNAHQRVSNIISVATSDQSNSLAK